MLKNVKATSMKHGTRSPSLYRKRSEELEAPPNQDVAGLKGTVFH